MTVRELNRLTNNLSIIRSNLHQVNVSDKTIFLAKEWTEWAEPIIEETLLRLSELFSDSEVSK